MRGRRQAPPKQKESPPKKQSPSEQKGKRATRAGGRTAAAATAAAGKKRTRHSKEDEEKEEESADSCGGSDGEDDGSGADEADEAGAPEKKDGAKTDDTKKDGTKKEEGEDGDDSDQKPPPRAATDNDVGSNRPQQDEDGHQSAVSSLSGASFSDHDYPDNDHDNDDDDDDDIPLSKLAKLKEERERKAKARAERARRKAKLKAKREAAAASAKEKHEAGKETAELDTAEDEVAEEKEEGDDKIVKEKSKGDGNEGNQDETVAAGDAETGDKKVAEQAAAAADGGDEEADQPADATFDGDIGAPPPPPPQASAVVCTTGSEAKKTAPVESSLPDVVEPPEGTTDAVPVEAADDKKAPAGADTISGQVNDSDSELHVTASAQNVPDATELLPPSQSSVPPQLETAEVTTLDSDSATQKPTVSEVGETEDAEMEEVGHQTIATDTHSPSATPNESAPMEVEETPPVPSSHIDDAGRKRHLQDGNSDVASPGHKRQRVASDESPPKPASSTEDSSQGVSQDPAKPPSEMPQSAQSPDAPPSQTPTADMAMDQVTAAELSPQGDSDEIRKVLEPALSASRGSPNGLSQPPTPLFESRPRSMSISPPSDPNHSRLCSPVYFAAQGHHDVAVEEEQEKELESVDYAPGPCLETIKMNLYLEGCKAHRGNGPERQFAGYWDALARNIAIGLRGKDRSKRWSNDEACNGIEYCLDSFLITKKLKRLHNELILAIMKQSLATLVEENRFKRHIPIAWRGKARKKIGYPPKPSSTKSAERGGDAEAKQKDGAETTTLAEDLKLDVADSRRLRSMFAYNASVWSASGQRCAATESCDAANEISHDNHYKSLRSVIPSATLPGALIIDPLIRSSVETQNMKVSEDAIWLATTAVRDYATAVLRNAVQNKVDARDGHIPATPSIASAATRTSITPLDLALGNCNRGSHSVRLDDQGLNTRLTTMAYSSGLLTSASMSTERKVSGAIHIAARQRLLTSKLPK